MQLVVGHVKRSTLPRRAVITERKDCEIEDTNALRAESANHCVEREDSRIISRSRSSRRKRRDDQVIRRKSCLNPGVNHSLEISLDARKSGELTQLVRPDVVGSD